MPDPLQPANLLTRSPAQRTDLLHLYQRMRVPPVPILGPGMGY